MIKLQPLRITTGWRIEYNKLLEVEPAELLEKDSIWIHFTEDILQMVYKWEQKQTCFVLDVGWYPETERNGNFRLVLIQKTDWENPIIEIKTKSKKELVYHIEKIVEKISENIYQFL